MKFLTTFCMALALLAASVQGFSVAAPRSAGMLSGGSSFVVSQRASAAATRASTASSSQRTRSTSLSMASQAKFGIFSPAVYVAKIALGQEKLNKIRGKAISLHSQYIGDFCEWVGAYHMRTRLIKKAKTNGDTLGFLV